jgi:patatin-related protein
MTNASDSGRGPHSARRGRTLRLALAMRGGVSLAVWIGGAVAELDLFRRSCNEAGPAAEYEPYTGEHKQHRVRGLLYRQLLANTKYDKVEIDILAGASAGGLNAVLFALSQSCCVVMDEAVRGTWVGRGSIWNLLQPPGWGRVPALLQGDEVFFAMAQDALMSLADPAAQPALPRIATTNGPDRLTVELAATLLNDPLAPNRPRRARFSFTKNPGSMSSTYTTIPADAGGVAAKTAIARLALAARTTSSFPGAFEPASIRSMHEGCLSPTDVNVDMATAFIYGRSANEPSEPYQVIDGGIYDNIQAIRRSPGTNPSERKLIYLDPEPPTPLASAPDVERASAASLITVVQRARALQQRTENADDELDAIRLNNEALEESRGRHAMLAAELRNLDANDGPDLSQDLGTAYLRTRIAADCERFAQLLTDPWSELCRPPFRATDYTALAPEAALRVREWFPSLYVNQSAVADDVYAHIDRTRVLIGWIHALEDLAEGSGVRTQPIPGQTATVAMRLGQWKQRSYRSLTVLVAAKQRTVDHVLAAPCAEPTPHRTTRTSSLHSCNRVVLRKRN